MIICQQKMEVFVSPRDIPLVFQGDHGWNSILTMENYTKWYEIFVISLELGGSQVSVLKPTWREEYEKQHPHDVAWSEHIPNPQFCEWLANNSHYEWDEASLDMIYGRWYRRQNG